LAIRSSKNLCCGGVAFLLIWAEGEKKGEPSFHQEKGAAKPRPAAVGSRVFGKRLLIPDSNRKGGKEKKETLYERRKGGTVKSEGAANGAHPGEILRAKKKKKDKLL